MLDVRRHAERADRSDDDSALSAAGRAMAERLARGAPTYAIVVSSPLRRAVETARDIARREPEIEPGLAYVLPLAASLDEYRGRLRSDAALRDAARDQLGVWESIARRAGADGHALAISHGGAIDAAAVALAERLGGAIGGPPIGYGEGVRVTYDGEGPTGLERLPA